MMYLRNEHAKEKTRLFLITVETEHELKAVDSVIRVALSSLGTVKEIKVIDPETMDSPSGGEKVISPRP
jgi:hypothetical protein